MSREHKLEVLEMIEKIQETSAPITVQIGSVSDTNQVLHDVIVIKDAPPVLAQRLIERGYWLSVRNNGVIVEKV